MKVFRYMSESEFLKYQNKDSLINEMNQSTICKTTSKGFCFGIGGKKEAQKAFEYLLGVVTHEIVCIFEVDDSILVKSVGVYRDPDKDNLTEVNFANIFDNVPLKEIEERCITNYNYENLKLVSYCKDVTYRFFNPNWKWIDITEE